MVTALPPDADEDLVIPSRLVFRFLAVMEAARSIHNSSITVNINVLMDAISGGAVQAGAASGTTVGESSKVVVGDELLSAKSAAARLGCSERAIRKACSEHRLVGVKAGRDWRILATDLDHYRFGDINAKDNR